MFDGCDADIDDVGTADSGSELSNESRDMFISTGRKISAICFQSADHNDGLADAPPFGKIDERLLLTGSWGHWDNEVSLWGVIGRTRETRRICSVQLSADITDICMIRRDLFAVAASSGDVSMFALRSTQHAYHAGLGCDFDDDDDDDSDDSDDDEVVRYDKPAVEIVSVSREECVHDGAATSLHVDKFRQHLVSVGEDGCMALFQIAPDRIKLLQSTQGVCSSSCCAAKFVDRNVVAVGGLSGKVSLWDIRALRKTYSEQKIHCSPEAVLVDSRCRVIHTISPHPKLEYMLATGSGNGIVNIWDLRRANMPVRSLRTHDSRVSGMLFVHAVSYELIVCGYDGVLLSLDFSRDGGSDGSMHSSARIDFVRSDVYQAELPLNALAYDLSSGMLVCAGDNESIFCKQSATPNLV